MEIFIRKLSSVDLTYLYDEVSERKDDRSKKLKELLLTELERRTLIGNRKK